MSYELKKMSRPTPKNGQQISDEESESVSDESDTELLKDARKIQERESKKDKFDTRLPKDLQETKNCILPNLLVSFLTFGLREGESEREKSDTQLPKDLQETKEDEIERDESDARLPKDLEETKIFPLSYEHQTMSRQTSRNIQQICDEIVPLLVELREMGDLDAGYIMRRCDQIRTLIIEIQEMSQPNTGTIKIKEICNQRSGKKCVEFDVSKSERSGKKSVEFDVSKSEKLKLLPMTADFDSGRHRTCMNFASHQEKVKAERVYTAITKNDHEDVLSSEKENACKVIDDLFKYESEETILRVFSDRIDTYGRRFRDDLGRTLLHRAVENNFLSVADLLIYCGVNPLSYDEQSRTPLHIAIEKGLDEMAAFIVSKLNNFVVRRMFGDNKSEAGWLEAGTMKQNIIEKGKDNTKADAKLWRTYDEHTVKPMFEIKELITKDLDKTLLQVLDSFVEEQPDGLSTVHVKLLDTDDKEKEPNDIDFDIGNHTAFQKMTISGKKDALNHPVVRVYMEHKWRHWCQKRFLFYGCLYLFSLFCLTYSAVTGVTASDLYTYNTRLQRSRAVTEFISYVYALKVLFTEIRQMRRHGRSYFAQFFNLMELLSAILILLVLPLRYTHLSAHWYVFALGYFLWAIRIFKYAIVFSQFGVYIEVIKLILVQDFVQFSIILLVINTIFSGTFLLVLKADDSLYTHFDTSSFFGILYVGVRTLIEAGPIVDYTGSDGYRVVGTMCMLVYMFFTIVVMLNILIAQLSETYNRTYKDCIKTVRANRAWIITRAERNDWKFNPIRWDWTKYYTREIYKVNMKKIKKNFSTIDVLSRKIDSIQKKQLKIGLDVTTMKRRQEDMHHELFG